MDQAQTFCCTLIKEKKKLKKKKLKKYHYCQKTNTSLMSMASPGAQRYTTHSSPLPCPVSSLHST